MAKRALHHRGPVPARTEPRGSVVDGLFSGAHHWRAERQAARRVPKQITAASCAAHSCARYAEERLYRSDEA